MHMLHNTQPKHTHTPPGKQKKKKGNQTKTRQPTPPNKLGNNLKSPGVCLALAEQAVLPFVPISQKTLSEGRSVELLSVLHTGSFPKQLSAI